MIVAKQIRKQSKAKGGQTTGSQLKGAPAKGGKTTSQHATTRSLTHIDANHSSEAVVDVVVLDKKKKAFTYKADPNNKICLDL